MKSYNKIKKVNVKGLIFYVRDETSDMKAINEVINNNGYSRRGFEVESGETWLDIGANCGAFSVYAAARGARVIAFEPDPSNSAMAQINCDANKFGKAIKVIHKGVTFKDKKEKVTLYRNTANGNLWRNSCFKKWKGGESITVELDPIGEFWKNDICVKLDAEGVEMPILEKYWNTKVKKLVFEWSFDIDRSIERFESVVEKLKQVYQNVVYSSYKKGFKEWQSSWFPACRTVFCY